MKTLSLIEKAFFLKKLKLFNELDLDLLLAVADKLHHDEYEQNERIFAYNQTANRIYFIVQGSIKIFDKDMRFLATLTNGDYFGDESIFNEQSRNYTAICKTDSLLLTLSKSHFLSMISESPSIAVALLQIYAQQLPCRIKP